MSYSSRSCFCLLDRIIHICVSCFRAVQFWLFEYNSLILTTGCSTWHLTAKLSLRIWELEMLISTKMAEAIRSSITAWNWVTLVVRVIQRFFMTGFTQNRPRKGRSKMLSPCAVRQMQKLATKKNQTHECCMHCFRGCRSGRSACHLRLWTRYHVTAAPFDIRWWRFSVNHRTGGFMETWIPTCTVTFWSRAWSPPFRNCFPT